MRTESQVVNEWIEKAEQRTRLEERRANLILRLKEKFPGQSIDEVVETIEQQPSLPLLQIWFAEAVRAPAFRDFVAVLRR